MKTKGSPRAVGYVRVSTASQAKEGESLTTQKTQIEEHCQRHNLDLIEIYADEGISGKDKDRPDLLRLLSDAESHKFDMVVVTKLTRFGRSARDLSNNIGQLDDNKILFVSLKEALDTSNAAGRLLRGILMNIAEFEHETIFTQMAENRNIRWASGKIHMGQSPFGYRWDKEKRCFEINPDEAAIYKKIIDWYLNGESYKTICIKLRDMGIKAKRAYFSPATIGGVLKNQCYTGKYTVNKKVFKDKLKSKVDKPVEENIVIELPPLITKTTWLKVQERISFNVVKTKRTVFPEFWLRNVLECGECKTIIRPKMGGNKFKNRYYACYWKTASKRTLASYGKEDKCKLPYIKAEELEDTMMYY
ncbi:MAG: recombinase family protein, partial [Deltaproteobacteria bacterium]|nr:recombinase family protein [Deltaproteobacteria bacterium]